ncbi:hypothetical protein GCM10009587_30840 [Microbacterium maritypicum]
MNAAIAKVPAVMAVPTDVAGVFRSVVMPAIETVSAFTANDACTWVRTTTIRGNQEAFLDATFVGATVDMEFSSGWGQWAIC